MEHLDKLIPLAILGVVGAFLVFLLRRAAREKETLRVESAPVEPAGVSAAEPLVATKTEPPAKEVATTAPPVTSVVKQKKKRQRTPAPIAVTPTPLPTPIHTVLD